MARFVEWLRFRITVAPFSRLPAPIWFLVASPLLWWAWGCEGPVFYWPQFCSRSPLRASFWCVRRGWGL